MKNVANYTLIFRNALFQWALIWLSLPILSYMVDAADREKIEASRNELHNLLDKPQLQGIPVRDLLLIFFFF